MSRRADLPALLDSLDPRAPLAERHLWLIALLDWVRGNGRSAADAVGRVQLFIDAVENDPRLAATLREWWSVLLETVDITTLLADFGFAPRTALASELAERLRRKLLPSSPETIDASDLFGLALPRAFDAQWIAALDAGQLGRLAVLLHAPQAEGATRWQRALLDAITYCAGQVLSTGFAPELRLRMNASAREAQPFHALIRDVEALRIEVLHPERDPALLDEAAQRLRERLDACRAAAATIYTHLEDNGISVGLVFRLRQLRERILRIRALLDCVLSDRPAVAAAGLTAQLVQVAQERRSLRALIASNSSLLAAKVAERSAETGSHYITRDRAAYLGMLRKAAGGGVLTAGTTWLKFVIFSIGLSAFWLGFWAGAAYAASFVIIQLLHCTLATKQPAMTAPAMAAKLKDLASTTDDAHQAAVEDFVDEVTHLVRSQVAAVLGNVLLVVPAVVLLSWAIQAVTGHPMIGRKEAEHVAHSLHLLGPTVLFSAFTGVLLFASSIIAGWTENWFVLHRLDSAMRYNPRITGVLGAARAGRWAGYLRANISGFASNISLGFMLGLVPAFAAFFGLGLEVRHVTLSAGQLAAGAAAWGWQVVHAPALWWAAASIPLIGAMNLTVSFTLALLLALRAQSVSGVDRVRIRRAIWARVRRAPLSFLLPRGPRQSTPDTPHP